MSEQATQTEKRCRMEGCKRPYRAKSYCNVHYRQWRQGKLGKTRFKICTKEECLARREARGLCKSHLEEWRASRGKGAAAEETGGGKAEAKEAPAEAKPEAKAEEKPEEKAEEKAGEAAPPEPPAAEDKSGAANDAPEAEKTEG